MIPKIELGDRVRLSRPHPCGGTWWVVTRTGIDIGLRCETCGRRVMVPRRRVEQRMRERIAAGGE